MLHTDALQIGTEIIDARSRRAEPSQEREVLMRSPQDTAPCWRQGRRFMPKHLRRDTRTILAVDGVGEGNHRPLCTKAGHYVRPLEGQNPVNDLANVLIRDVGAAAFCRHRNRTPLIHTAIDY